MGSTGYCVWWLKVVLGGGVVEGGSTIALDVVAILELKNRKYGK